MAAHVFDATEPTLDSTQNRPVGAGNSAAAAPMTDGPMFAAQPAVFHKLQGPSRVGAGPVIGLAVAAVVLGGLVFAMSRHNQGSNGATNGVHTLSQPPAVTAAASKPVLSPATGEANPAPAPSAAPVPHHLRIVTAPPPPARIARPIRARVPARAAERAPVAPEAVTPPAPLTVAPAQSAPPPAQAVAPAPAPVTPAPSIAAPAPQPTPAPSPAPTTAPSTPSPDASASSAQPAPQ